jgi:aquaporin Z
MGTTNAYTKPDVKKRTADGDFRIEIARRLLAELIGTFALTFIAAGSEVAAAITHGGVSEAAGSAAPALVVMAMIYTFGGQSGAHFNPGVTLAFALRRDFPWSRVTGYWLAQFAGAILAALLLRILFGLAGHVGANQPHFGVVTSLVIEIVLTFLLVTVILGTATSSKIVGHNAALAVGGTVALAGLFGGPISGASMNTARSLGPALLSGDVSNLWIYAAGPLAGVLLAVAFAYLLRGRTNPHAVEVAKGD